MVSSGDKRESRCNVREMCVSDGLGRLWAEEAVHDCSVAEQWVNVRKWGWGRGGVAYVSKVLYVCECTATAGSVDVWIA